MPGRWIGQPLPRFEDLRLVRGAGRYTDDVSLPNQAYAAFVRSPHPHARIISIDTHQAASAPGVLAVLTGADYLRDGGRGIAHSPLPADAIEYTRPAFTGLNEAHMPLAVE